MKNLQSYFFPNRKQELSETHAQIANFPEIHLTAAITAERLFIGSNKDLLKDAEGLFVTISQFLG